MFSLLQRQIWTLAWKDLLLMFSRNRTSYTTVLRAFTAPLIFAIYLSVIFRVYWPKETYGIGTPRPIRTLSEGFSATTGGRDTFVLANYGPSGGDIERVIDLVAEAANTPGKTVRRISTEDELLNLCRSTFSATTKCYGAVEFYSSPNEGGNWTYQIRADGGIGSLVNLEKGDNDVQVYPLPIQRAVDQAIATVSGNDSAQTLSNVQEYGYSEETQEEWKKSITLDIQKANANFIAVVWYIALVGLPYQLVGLVATEREQGMSDLIDSMLPNVRRWETLVVRILGHWVAFTITYLPGFIAVGATTGTGIFPDANVGIIIIFFLIAGLSTTSYSVFCASFFRKAQLSGITTTLIALALGVAAQVASKSLSSPAVAVLSLLFQPMAFVFGFINMAKFQQNELPVNLIQSSVHHDWDLPLIVIIAMFVVQIFAYPVLGFFVERALYSPTSTGRKVIQGGLDVPITIRGFTKRYQPGWFTRIFGPILRLKRKPVLAVRDLTLENVLPGQINVLVGANGCGKSTTLNAIAGLSTITSGEIILDGSGGIGICPQKNVLWHFLTVQQHAEIFTKLKSAEVNPTSKEDLTQLINACGLEKKHKAFSGTLSGGQKRKLQLIMMLTGGSKVCCVDEVSGGLDPISRRNVWDILLAERGKRTFILTTHFLDEAEFLADNMVIMSQGQLKAEGSVSELKERLGGSYRLRLLHGAGYSAVMDTGNLFDGLPNETMYDQTIYSIEDHDRAIDIIQELERRGMKNYTVAGPTMEEVFLKMAVDPKSASGESNGYHSEPISMLKSREMTKRDSQLNQLQDGEELGFFQQLVVLFRKRLVIVKRNPLPYLAALIIPIVAVAGTSMLVSDYSLPNCDIRDQVDEGETTTLEDDKPLRFVVGPSSALQSINTTEIMNIFQLGGSDALNGANINDILVTVDTIDEFNQFIEANYANVTPGGFFLSEDGGTTVFAYQSDISTRMFTGVVMQNVVNSILSGIPITSKFEPFNFPWPKNTGDALQFAMYFSLVFCAFPAFFALYPTVERKRKIRTLQYSNGVRPLPLWAAYLAFDGMIILIVCGVVTAVLAGVAKEGIWNLGCLFVVLLLYGLASILLSYVISLVAKSQLAAFAFAAGIQGFMLMMFLTAEFTVRANSPPDKVDSTLVIIYFTLNLVTPSGNLLRALMASLNLFSTLCVGTPPTLATNPGGITLLGGPILILAAQCIVLFAFLLFWDSSKQFPLLHSKQKQADVELSHSQEKEVSDEVARVASSPEDGLRVLHVSKSFKSRTRGSVTAVDDVSFGVRRDEVFALVGPNGAGKSTTISMLRGNIRPSRAGASIVVDGVEMLEKRKTARARLGVCPQFDAVDQMTVLEHLEFYGGVRGVADRRRNAEHIVRAVGLGQFADRMAAKLSGGNLRKLSLGIALTGNPEVLLLDEPSSGMDPLAKRTMWATLAHFVPRRSILLTTHSMEEADHLASRVGVLATRMLDLGTTDHLRGKHGHGFHVHVVCADAPNTSDDSIARVVDAVKQRYPGTEVVGTPYHGQLRLHVPANTTPTDTPAPASSSSSAHAPPPQTGVDAITPSPSANTADHAPFLDPAATHTTTTTGYTTPPDPPSVGSLTLLLSSGRADLGIGFFSVAPSTFDEVFLRVVGRHGVTEEDRGAGRRGAGRAAGWPWNKLGGKKKGEEEGGEKSGEGERGRNGWAVLRRWLLWKK